MLKNQDIICIALPNWEGDYMKTIVQMMSLLSRHNKVLYVDYEYTLKDLYQGIRKKADVPYKRTLGIEPRLREFETRYKSKVHVLTPPPVIPINFLNSHSLFKKGLWLNTRLLQHSIKKAMKKLNMKQPVVINAFNPFMGLYTVGSFKELANIYYCYDEIAAAEWTGKHGKYIEEEFCKKIDGIVYTSDFLAESKTHLHKYFKVLKNGVDFELFNKVAQSMPNVNISKVVGYIGSIDERFDIETMEYVVRNNPRIEFHLVGRITNHQAHNTLVKYDNVTFYGSVPAQDVPDFIRNFDLGIIPYKCTEFTKAVYPLKLNEYLAAGKPVVLTEFAVYPEFEGLVSFAKTPKDFSVAINQELASDNPERIRSRIDFARSNSWESRAVELGNMILDLKQQKQNK